ncbi:hypothetical protein IE077_003170 [Cardiosporidium cionae]|uniref:Uncharacterized protein n=1 Tax=Cardiosporidium cionae TaxID=476202 RepID=A0ABQ7J8X0_9APIC|nr:hypothetical protein IE077_003170 [Cardiosporidium cionae]|eukprot:KAF8820448.1 hypothetical protein IE077_003170 [Cardiosporidium cionae]
MPTEALEGIFFSRLSYQKLPSGGICSIRCKLFQLLYIALIFLVLPAIASKPISYSLVQHKNGLEGRSSEDIVTLPKQSENANGEKPANLQQEAEENEMCEPQVALASMMDSEMIPTGSDMDKIMEKLEEKSKNHQLCQEMASFRSDTYCNRKAKNGTVLESKCGGKGYDQKIVNYVNKKGCLNALLLNQAILSDYVSPTQKAAIDQWINQYVQSMEKVSLDTELFKIYKASKKLLEDLQSEVIKTIKAFSTNALKETWKERKERLVGIMCAVGAGDAPGLSEQITVNNDIVMIKVEFSDLLKKAYKAFNDAFWNYGRFIDALNVKGGFLDRLTEIHERFHAYRMKKITPTLQQSPNSGNVLNTQGTGQGSLLEVSGHSLPSISTSIIEGQLPAMDNIASPLNVPTGTMNTLQPSVLVPPQSILPIPPQQSTLAPPVPTIVPPKPLNSSETTTVQKVETQIAAPVQQEKAEQPIGLHSQSMNSVGEEKTQAANSAEKAIQDKAMTNDESTSANQLIESSGVSLHQAVQDALLEINVFKVDSNTVTGSIDETLLKRTLDSGFLDLKDVDCLLKLALVPQAVTVSIVQLFEELTPDPMTDLREWYNLTIDEAGAISAGVSENDKGLNMSKYVHRFSKFMDISYQNAKKAQMSKIDNLAEISSEETKAAPIETKPAITIEKASLSNLQLLGDIFRKKIERDHGLINQPYANFSNFGSKGGKARIKSTNVSPQISSSALEHSFVDAHGQSIMKSDAPTVALLSADDGFSADSQRLSCDAGLLQYNLNRMVEMMSSPAQKIMQYKRSIGNFSVLLLLGIFLFS